MNVIKNLLIIALGLVVLAACGILSNVNNVEVRQIQPLDDTILEEWKRVTEDQDILGVNASRTNDSTWPWTVYINAAEFIRTEPLQSELHQLITDALNSIPGVIMAVHSDREVWVVQGDVSGEALIRSCAEVLDRLYDALHDAIE
jgi:hypothetical protein